MDEEFKKNAVDALKAGADAAKKLGGIAYDLGKKGFEAAASSSGSPALPAHIPGR